MEPNYDLGGFRAVPDGVGITCEYRHETGADQWQTIVTYEPEPGRVVTLVVARDGKDQAVKSARAVADAVTAALGGKPLPELRGAWRESDRAKAAACRKLIEDWFAKKGGVRYAAGTAQTVSPA